MTMKVRYNSPTNHALIQFGNNNKSLSKSLEKVASGMKINSAADDAANFSISSRMRVKLRALEQDTQNVQNGSSILRTAEGGIQGQIELLKTIREKVIDAANDSNTDEDRLTIQKEIFHLYDEMESLAYGTDFNSKKPLLGDKLIKSVESDLDELGDSSLNLISDAVYKVLDGVEGPFATFTEYSSRIASSNRMSGGVNSSTRTSTTIDFSNYGDVSQLNNVGLRINNRVFVFTDDMSKNYRHSSYSVIKVALGSTLGETLNTLSPYVSGRINGTTMTVTTSAAAASNDGGTITATRNIDHAGAGAGVSGVSSGGYTHINNDPDSPPSSKATLSVDLSGAASNTGFKFNNNNFRILAPGETSEGTVDQTLVIGESSSGDVGLFDYNFDGSNLTFTAKYVGEYYNNYRITDGYTYKTTETTTTDYEAYSGFNGTIESVVTGSTQSTYATWEMDLSGMTVDDFSEKYRGQILSFNTVIYKFYDSAVAPKLEGFAEDTGSRIGSYPQIDIDKIRQRVDAGNTLAEAFTAELNYYKVSADGDKVIFTSSAYGTAGNSRNVNFRQETLRHYDIDFSTFNVDFPEGLYKKGFRVYCATDSVEWFNFIFTDGTKAYDSEEDNIKSINIDVSAARNVDELLQTIYDQATPLLEGSDSKFNHHMRLAVDMDNKILTVYDHRRFDVNDYPTYQEHGAKIADGVELEPENEIKKQDYFVRDFVIQHTDKANMNIHIMIPQMTLDHVFDSLPDADKNIFDYVVTDKESRNSLLGNPNLPGILDRGLAYLLDAATSVGAQNRRLEFTAENILTEFENLTAAESVIRDADMAKEMTAYTKHNILAQASQTMLAQANQNQSMILSLLE